MILSPGQERQTTASCKALVQASLEELSIGGDQGLGRWGLAGDQGRGGLWQGTRAVGAARELGPYRSAVSLFG